jgi:tetratricopeptide (TPR) repeat protein
MAKTGAKKKRKKEDDLVARLAFVLLRYFRGWWDKVKLVRAGGFLPSEVTMWDHGDRPVPLDVVQRTADVTGFPRYLLGAALRMIRSFVLAAKGRSRPRRALAEVSIVELFPLAFSALDLILEPLDEPPSRQVSPPVVEDLEIGEALLERLQRRTAKQRWLLVERVPEFRNWALVEKLTRESLRLAPNHPRESLEWARLAVRLAELVDGTQEWLWSLQGYAGAALTNAWRVCNDLPAAREAQARARQLWDDGKPGATGLLNDAVLPWIEAALYRDERDFPQALKRIDEALALDNGELKGKILLTKASIHHARDESEAAVAANLEALPLLNAEHEPRLAWGVLYNLTADLVQLGRAEEARQNLPELRRLAKKLAGGLDLGRLVWMEAKVADACGNLDEARELFEQVRNDFDKPELIYDHALVSMELSVVLLKLGESARVRELAEETLQVFHGQQVPRETLAALKVFCEAAKQETATVELGRRVVRYLSRAKDDPGLRFKDGEADAHKQS